MPDSVMLDSETLLYFRDGKYAYPDHETANGKKDFWTRGDGWVLAGLAKVLQDMPTYYRHHGLFVAKFKALANAVVRLRTSLLVSGVYVSADVAFWSQCAMNSGEILWHIGKNFRKKFAENLRERNKSVTFATNICEKRI